jgi:hypothetical protein
MHFQVTGEDRMGGTGCMLENASKSSQERIGQEGRDACLRAHANVTGGIGWWNGMHT